MSYRPICDTWILARPKVKYYGSYPSGFLGRARALLGVNINDSVLHICSGKVKDYPYDGFGPNDKTLDLDPEMKPDFLQDASEPYPPYTKIITLKEPVKYPEWLIVKEALEDTIPSGWPAILADPPYTEGDAEQYAPGPDVFPKVNKILRNGLDAVQPGGRVGILHYVLPQPPNEKHCGYKTKAVAYIGVLMGFNNRIRVYSVFERLT